MTDMCVVSRRLMAAVGLIVAIAAGTLTMPTPARAARPAADGQVVRAWSDLALNTIRGTKGTDAQAARLYAMVNVAMYDAVNGLAAKKDRRTAALMPPDNDAAGDAVVAAAQAAHDVLAGLYQDRATMHYDPEMATTLARSSASSNDVERGRRWGSKVARAVLAARANDGTAPNAIPPFAIADASRYFGGPPPSEQSIDYAAAFNDVKILGSRANDDAAKTDTYWFWALGAGSDQPPGAWVQVAQQVSESRSLSLADTARLFTLETMAMADTVAPTATTKQTYNRRRPTFAIHDAEFDGNPDTVDDDAWTARAPTAGSPGEYWSGHSSFSSAAARALTGFFCDDATAFALTTDAQDGAPHTNATRTFSSFSEAAGEAGMSRIYGGLHFPYSNQAGLTAGRSIADEVLAHALLLQNQKTHLGACPL